jgi:predicted component of type VI protein secretion system
LFHALKNTLVSQGDKKVPCDAGIQNEDHSQALKASDGKTYRSVIGLLLYVARERADIMFTVKELAACMSAPNLCSLQRLRKLVGYLKKQR